MTEIPLTDFEGLIRLLVDSGVDFILVGGMAATVHGSARLTHDLDVVYRRSAENIRKLSRALQDHSPYLRGAPAGLPFQWDEPTIQAGLNFTLITDLGAIDLLGEITGGGGYEQLLQFAEPKEVIGVRCLCLGLEKLIQVKQAAGRPRDLEAIAELRALLEERNKALGG